MMGSAGMIVIDDRACMVQLGLRVAQFYMHESCGKCTPCREGTRWQVQLLRQDRGRRRGAVGARPAARRLRPHPRQVPLPARRRGRDADRELRRASSATSSRRTSTTAAARSAASRRSRACWRRSTSTRTTRRSRCRLREHARARLAHDRRPRGRGAEGHSASSRPPPPPGSRSRSSATSRASGRRSARAACAWSRSRGCRSSRPGCTLTAQDGMVVRTAADERRGGRGPERDARVHPRQPPARLPGLRQGRRVPAPGPDVPLRAGQHAHDVPEADVREADPDQPADRARPRALHPLLPLHALLRGRGRGRPARGREPRRAVDHHHLRGRALPRAVQRQRDRALPGRRADLDAVPLRGAALGDPERADASAGSARSAATSTRRRARARSSGSSRATTPRSTRAGSATRAARPSRRCAPRIASSTRCAAPARAGSSRSAGRRRSTRPSGCCAAPTAGS